MDYCTLFIEDFKDISVAPGPFLLENFTCRKCGLIPADHNRKPEGFRRHLEADSSAKLCNVYITSKFFIQRAIPSNYSKFKDLTSSVYSGYLKLLTVLRKPLPKRTTTKNVLENDELGNVNHRFNYVGWGKAGDIWIPGYIKCEEDFLALLKDYSELSFSLEIALEELFSGRRKQQDKNYIRYDTRKGFDDEFNHQLECDLRFMLATSMETNLPLESAIDRVLFNSITLIQYPLQETNVLEKSGFAILFCIPVQYSSIKLDYMISRLQWPIEWNVNSGDDVKANLLANRCSSLALKNLVDSATSIDDESAMVDFALAYLNRFRNVVQESTSYSESLRRWIINGVLLAAASPTGEHLSSAHETVNMESEYTEVIPKERKRIGTGPLDYIFFSPQSSSKVVCLGAHKRKRLDEDSDTEAKDTSELDGDDDDDDSDAGVVGLGNNILEAKQLLEGRKLTDAAGQVFAQSLDNLSNIRVGSSSNVEVGTSKEGESGGEEVVGVAGRRAIRHVKSILATGHHYMFFTFTEYDVGKKEPTFQFLGTYSIDVLPSILNPGSQDSYRESGITLGLDINRTQISTLLRALYFFMRNDMID
eukprot:gene23740-32125_t